MKKLLYLLPLLVLVSLIACENKETINYTFNDYTFEKRVVEQEIFCDDYVTLDGILDEDFWETSRGNEQVVVSTLNSDYSLKTRTYMSDLGLYFGIECNDPAVYYDPSRSAAKNTSAEIYFSPFSLEGDSTVMYNLRVVPASNEGDLDNSSLVCWRYNNITLNWDKYGYKWIGKCNILGDINTSTTEGYTAEVFIPWESIGSKNTGYIKYTTAFNHVESEVGGERKWIGATGCNINNGTTYLVASNTECLSYNSVMDELIQIDEGMTIDGVLNEECYVSSKPFTYSYTFNNTVLSLSCKTHLTDKGAYLGFVIKDPYLYNADTSVRSISFNSSIELYLAAQGKEKFDSNNLQLRLSIANDSARYRGNSRLSWPWSTAYVGMLSQTTIQGTLNSEDVSQNEGWTLELFVPWSSFGLTEKPEYILVSPYLIHNEDATSSVKTSPWKYFNFNGSFVEEIHSAEEKYVKMNDNGVINSFYDLDLITITEDLLDGDYYTKEFSLLGSPSNAMNGYTVETSPITNATFTLPIGAQVVNNNDGTYVLKINKNDISNYTDGLEYKVKVSGFERKNIIILSEINHDGELDDLGYKEVYTLNNEKYGIESNIYSYISKQGVYIGGVIKDAFVKSDTRTEVYISTSLDKIEDGNTFQFRLYPVTNKVNSYKYDSKSSWFWSSASIESSLKTKIVTGGYQFELFIPFSSLNITTLENFSMLISNSFYEKETSTSVLSYSGNDKVNNAYLVDLENYKVYGKEGIAYKNVYFDNIVLTSNDIKDGYYVKEFFAYNENDMKVVGFDFWLNGSYITYNQETKTYTLKISTSESSKITDGFNICGYLEKTDTDYTFRVSF